MGEPITRETLENWYKAKCKLDNAKTLELILRNRIAEEVLDGAIKGTHHNLYGLNKASVTAKLNLSVAPEELKVSWKDLSQAERDCIKFEPTVKTGPYNKLPEGSLLRRIVSAKPGTPTLKVKLFNG